MYSRYMEGRKIRLRRGAMSDPTASYELWIFWQGRWECRGVGYGGSEPSTGGYGYLCDENLEIRVSETYDGPIPFWCVEAAHADADSAASPTEVDNG